MSDTQLNAIGVLRRREIEARMVAELVDALGREFGRDRVLAVVREAVIRIARRQGRELKDAMGGCSLAHLERSLEHWTQDGALELRVLERSEGRLSFDVTRCRYAELYRELGIPELGEVLSCSRDFALVEGFNPDVELTRTRTILGGADRCDFRYARKP